LYSLDVAHYIANVTIRTEIFMISSSDMQKTRETFSLPIVQLKS